MSLAAKDEQNQTPEWEAPRWARNLYVLSASFASAGRNTYFFGAGWIIAHESGNATDLVVFLALGNCAELAASAPAGYLADCLDRKKLSIFADVARLVIMLATCWALLTGHSYRALFVSVILYSAMDRVYLTSAPALIPSLVSAKGLLLSLNAVTYVGMQVGNLLAAVAVGILLDTTPQWVCFLFGGSSFCLSLMTMLLLPRGKPYDRGGLSFQKIIRSTGVDSARLSSIIPATWIAGYAFIYAMGMLLSVLASVFVLKQLSGSATDFGLLESGWAAGSIAGASVLTLGIATRINGRAIPSILALAGLILSAFHFAPSVPLGIVQMSLLGAAHNIVRVLIEVEIQHKTAGTALGRVKGKIHLISMAASLVLYGSIVILGEAVTPSEVFLAFGMAMVAFAGIGSVILRKK